MNRKIIVLINWKSITTKAKLFFWTNKKIKIPIEKAIEKFSLWLWWSKINWKKNLIIFLFVWLSKKRKKKNISKNLNGSISVESFFENWKKNFLTTRNKKKSDNFFSMKNFRNKQPNQTERKKTIKPDDKIISLSLSLSWRKKYNHHAGGEKNWIETREKKSILF